MNEADREILTTFKRVNDASGAFAVGILNDSLSRGEQVAFAHRLVDLAELIRDRALRTPGLVVEGSVVNDCNSGATDTAHSEEAPDEPGQPPAVH